MGLSPRSVGQPPPHDCSPKPPLKSHQNPSHGTLASQAATWCPLPKAMKPWEACGLECAGSQLGPPSVYAGNVVPDVNLPLVRPRCSQR